MTSTVNCRTSPNDEMSLSGSGIERPRALPGDPFFACVSGTCLGSVVESRG
eukprot:CAMPEP_0197413506 /NCGR_PEP_ID=MMETSP1170-20131217/362_1 /TAXON_ID=54406 /ORGANISM="Sarcinochrysis sp, Strain CCMP770" /LENGTH=50 /DNA_ID=CAMNT_0042940093 /DNA_START=57 /DNA_END=205 /DNA_ORIENTATION=-